MKKLVTLAVIGASAATLMATAASAQPYRGHNDWMSVNQRQAQLQHRIDRGVAHGDLTRREAYRLQHQMRNLARLEARYRMNGLSSWERADLDRRFDRLSAQIRFERHDRQEYGYGYRH
jgi:Ni/Co efflux regulator RcnB